MSHHYIDLTLEGIKYFQTYYQTVLLLAVSVSMIGWMFFLYQQLDIDVQNPPKLTAKTIFGATAVTTIISGLIYGEFPI